MLSNAIRWGIYFSKGKKRPASLLLLLFDGHLNVNESNLTGAVNGDRTHDHDLGIPMNRDYHLSKKKPSLEGLVIER
jgi:hypothetical protein